MKETYFCTKTKKIQKNSQKSSENHGNEKSKCDLYGLRYSCAGGGFFGSGYRSLIGKVLRFFSIKFRSLGGFWVESILLVLGTCPTAANAPRMSRMSILSDVINGIAFAPASCAVRVAGAHTREDQARAHLHMRSLLWELFHIS